MVYQVNENSNNFSRYYCVYCIFEQINAGEHNIKHSYWSQTFESQLKKNNAQCEYIFFNKCKLSLRIVVWVYIM